MDKEIEEEIKKLWNAIDELYDKMNKQKLCKCKGDN